MDIQNIVKVAVDAYHGRVQNYSTEQSMELLKKALVEANGGSTTLNYRNIRDGKCQGLFTLVEEILSWTVVEGLMANDYFMALVEMRNVPAGDKPVFVVEDSNLFTVSKISDGNVGIRRQRLSGEHEVAIETERRAVKIYEELDRVLSGRVDFNAMINKVAESFQRKLLDEIYALWMSVSENGIGGDVYYFNAAGTYDEDELLDLINHVEASANGQTATVIGTKKALRALAPTIQGSESKSDLYQMGYYSKVLGANVVMVPQRHKVNSTDFAMNDNVITVVAGGEKPIKLVYEGEPLMIMGDPLSNGDLTHEYFYSEKYGMGLVLAGNTGVGRYDLA